MAYSLGQLSRTAVVITIVVCAIACSSAVADLTLTGLSLQHDYFLGDLTDLTGNARHGTLGSAATLVFPVDDNPGYVGLPGGSGTGDHGSHLLFDGSTLADTLGPEGDASIELWFDFDPGNPFNDGDFNSTAFRIFSYESPGGSYGHLQLDQRNVDNGPDGRLGFSKDANDIVNGAWGGGDVARENVEGVHQYVLTFDGGAGVNGTWTGYIDGSPIAGDEFGGGQSGNTYQSTIANVFTAAGGGNFAIGGKHPDATGASPAGKLYRTLIYNSALTPTEVQGNYNHGLNAFTPPPPPPPDPKKVTIVTSGFNTPDTVYLSNNIHELSQRPFNGVATWIAPPGVSRLPSGRLRRLEGGYDGGDLGQTVIWRRYNTPGMYEPAIADLQATPASARMNSNFLHLLTSNNPGVMDWYDDSWWDQITHNIGTMAKVAKEGGLKGLLIDSETYGLPMWSFSQVSNGLPAIYGGKTWEQVRAQVRHRGREFGQAISDEHPDSTIMFFHAMSFAALQVNHDRSNRWPTLAEAPFGLMGPFLDGILEGTSDETIIVDANSWKKLMKQDSEFEFGRDLVAVEGKALSEVPQLYEDKVKVGFSLRTSYDPSEGDSPGEFFKPADPDSNYFSPSELESSLSKAIEHGDGYVLFWEGHANWWLDSATAVPADGAPYGDWSKYIDPVYWDALANARAVFDDPLPPILPGDVNFDSLINGADIDLLRKAISMSSTDPLFDLDGDTDVDGADVNYLFTTILQTSTTDVSLDGHVDADDLAIIRLNMGSTATGFVPWDQGNIVGDGAIDQLDLVALRFQYGFDNSTAALTSAPEPSSLLLMWLGTWMAALKRSERLTQSRKVAKERIF